MFQKMDSLLWMVRIQLHAFFTDEDGDVNIVSMVVLIGIVVLLAIVFRDAISGLITTLVTKIQGNALDAVDGN